MGINDIFEPTKADFSLMADDKSLYVKNIEQMININIRTQSTQQLRSEFGRCACSRIQWERSFRARVHTVDCLIIARCVIAARFYCRNFIALQAPDRGASEHSVHLLCRR
jgi:hypothetical protein